MSDQQEKLGVKAARGAAWISIEMLGIQLSSFVVFVALSRYLTPKDFGIIGISFILVQVIQNSIINNVAILVAKDSYPTDIEFDTTFWLSISVSVLCYLVSNILIYLSSTIYSNPVLTDTLYSMSFILLFYGVTRTHEAWFIRFFQFKTLAIRGIIASVCSGIIGIYLVATGHGILSIVIQQILLLIISFLLMYYQCPWQPAFRLCKKTAKKTLIFNRNLLPSAVSNTLSQNLDSVLISSLFGLTVMGYYSVAKRIRLAAQMVTFTPLRGVVLSSLAEIQNDEIRLQKNFVKGLLILASLMLPVFTLLAITSKSLILFLFGEVWLPSATLLSFLALAGLFTTIILYIENLFIIKSKPSLNNISSLGYMIFVVLLFFILPTSIVNIGMAFLIPYFVIFPLVLIKACHLINLPFKRVAKNLIELFLSTMVIGVIAHLIFNTNFLPNDVAKVIVSVVIVPITYYHLVKMFAPASFAALLDVSKPILIKIFAR